MFSMNLQINNPVSNIVNNHLAIIPYNIENVTRRKVFVINNVYQSKYKFGISSTGLGDFIRGSYFMLEFCFKYKFKPKIIFNNCISTFLKMKTRDLDKVKPILDKILSFPNVNFTQFLIAKNGIIFEPVKDTRRIMSDFVEYLTFIPVYNHNVFAYCISYPNDPISENAKKYMRRILEPTNEMKVVVHNILNDLSFGEKMYSVIHIRSGDVYLNKNSSVFKKEYVKKLIDNIHLNIVSGKKYLLISDNNQIKKILLENFPAIKALFNDITHFGEGVVLEEDKVKNTMIDFYLLSLAAEIFSYSSYKHGSGFSYWCAKTYNVPYVCKYI